MPRKGGRDTTAAQLRRERNAKPPSTEQPRTEQFQPLEQPPEWLKLGAIVDYSEVIGGPPTVLNARVIADPFRMYPSRDTRWVTFIDKKRGWVAIEALQLVGKP